MNIPIIPVPQSVKLQSGVFHFPDVVTISYSSEDPRNRHTADLLSLAISTGLNIKSAYSTKVESTISLSLFDSSDPEAALFPFEKRAEGYHIKISERNISLKAFNSKGLFYAVMSLIQLVENTRDRRLPQVEIIDYPDLKIRAISDDISRGQVSTLDNFKRIISFISRYKMNTYLPYLEDMIQFDKYPSIGKNRGALSKSEIKEIIAFADLHFVEVIPVFQTLGHYENILSLPEFIKYAEYPGAASLCVADDKVYSFLEDMLKEVFPLFPSKYFHMGADESYDVGLGRSKELLSHSSIATLHANHYKKVYDICKANGKEVMMYGDIILDLPEILTQIPKDITIIDWHYRADYNYPSTNTFKNHGFNYLVSPSVWNFVTTFPTNLNALPNIYHITKSGLQNNSIGMVNSNWGDYGAETLKELILYGYAYSAQCSWSFDKTDVHSFSTGFFNNFFGTDNVEGYEIYKTLGNPLNQMMWHEVWRHPLLPQRTPSWWENNVAPVAKMNWLKMSNSEILTNISTLKKTAKRNLDHLDILEFYTALNSYYTLKLETQSRFQIYQSLSESEKKDLIQLVDSNINELNTLRDKYKSLWLRYYKKDNLNMIEDKFNRLISYFSEIKGQLVAVPALFPYSPVLTTDWIYVKGKGDSLSTNSEFFTEFDLDKLPSQAIIQLMGDSYAKLFINDKFIDEVYVRRSLSLYTEYQRVKMINVLPYLKTGKNIVRLEVVNYSKRGAAGFNLTSFMPDNDFSFDSYANDYLKNSRWFGREVGTSKWENTVSKKYPFDVIAPDFSSGRKSWIER